MKDSESSNSLCRFFPIKEEPGFFHCGDTTRAGPQYLCVCLCVFMGRSAYT